jgi:hypothetical protein
MPPEEPRPEPGATNLKPAALKDADPKANELKPNQQRAILALLEAPSVAAAARESGIGERTIHRWLHDDPDFQNELREKRRQRLDQAATRLQSTAGQAVQAIVELLASKDHIEPGRAALVRTALDFAFRAGAYIDIAERLDNLEEAVKDNPPKEPEPIFDRSLLEDDEAA